jgi:hypothetical protein
VDFPHVALVVDCTFQASNRIGSNFEEQKLYFSGKHFQYGLKRELAHLPNGVSVYLIYVGSVAFVSKPHPGARHDFTIFQENLPWYRDLLQKKPGEETFVDLVANQTSWALLADKGYLGAGALLRAIIPKKNLPHQRLSAEDTIYNQRLSSARVICENFYGRLKGLFRICTERYRGTFVLYNL